MFSHRSCQRQRCVNEHFQVYADCLQKEQTNEIKMIKEETIWTSLRNLFGSLGHKTHKQPSTKDKHLKSKTELHYQGLLSCRVTLHPRSKTAKGHQISASQLPWRLAALLLYATRQECSDPTNSLTKKEAQSCSVRK